MIALVRVAEVFELAGEALPAVVAELLLSVPGVARVDPTLIVAAHPTFCFVLGITKFARPPASLRARLWSSLRTVNRDGEFFTIMRAVAFQERAVIPRFDVLSLPVGTQSHLSPIIRVRPKKTVFVQKKRINSKLEHTRLQRAPRLVQLF